MKNNHFRGKIYQFNSKKQYRNRVDTGNSDSELTNSSSQSDSELHYSDIADTEIGVEKDVLRKTFSFFKKVSKESHKNEQKKVCWYEG